MPDAPDTLMLFAAGRGTRMAPLTDQMPKPLVPVAGQPLIDRALRLARTGGARRIVVNTHHLGGQLVKHLSGAADVAISDESAALLETGGGLRHALPLLGSGPVLTLNPDAIWTGPNPIRTLRDAWDGARMDALLMLVPVERATAHHGSGDFSRRADGRIMRGGPLVYGGAQIIRPDRLGEIAGSVFSLNLLWDLLLAGGRVYGLIHPGGWCDVGRPDCVALAEALLAADTDVQPAAGVEA